MSVKITNTSAKMQRTSHTIGSCVAFVIML